MQIETERRTNAQRSREMRERLMTAARALFVSEGYGDTGTPALVQAAGVTRGALYHHFPDKQAIFRAVVEREAAEVAQAVEAADPPGAAALDRLLAGAEAYFVAMAVEGRTRLLLVEGPAVLGRAAMREIEAASGERTLRDGLEAAMREAGADRLPLDALTALLSATFDRAALEIAEGRDPAPYRAAIRSLLAGLFRSAA
jgi:AcrR family transcriptional regulator